SRRSASTAAHSSTRVAISPAPSVQAMGTASASTVVCASDFSTSGTDVGVLVSPSVAVEVAIAVEEVGDEVSRGEGAVGVEDAGEDEVDAGSSAAQAQRSSQGPSTGSVDRAAAAR